MKTAYLQNLGNSFLEKLASALSRNGFKNISISYTDRVIYAEKRVKLFTKKAKLKVRIIDEVTDNGGIIEIMVNDNNRKYDTAENMYEKLEERILDLVYINF